MASVHAESTEDKQHARWQGKANDKTVTIRGTGQHNGSERE